MFGIFRVTRVTQFADLNGHSHCKKIVLLSQPCNDEEAKRLTVDWLEHNGRSSTTMCTFTPDVICLD